MADTTLDKSRREEVLYLRPSSGWSALNLRDLWRYRELIYFLTLRDLKVRYKQTILGAAWAIIQPFFTMVVFTIFFGRLAKVPTEGVPGPIFYYTGLLPWGLFTKALSDAGRSMVSNRNMITKIYFPRLVIPISTVVSGLVDFAIAFTVLLGMIAYYNYSGTEYTVTLTSRIWTLPLFLLLALITALGVGLWLSAMNVLYRDIGYILPFLTQFWMFITPVAYPASMVPDKWRLLYGLNPMTGVIEGFRWAVLGVGTPPGTILGVSALIAVLILISGLYYFRRMERTFADMV